MGRGSRGRGKASLAKERAVHEVSDETKVTSGAFNIFVAADIAEMIN